MSHRSQVILAAVTAIPTPWGWAGLGASTRGLVRCSWPWPEAGAARRALAAAPVAEPRAEGFLAEAVAGLRAFFEELRDPLDGVTIDGRIFTDWQRRVYRVVRQIPPGEVRSYGEVARECGQPRGGRAVGQALAANPLPLLIPCHRVVGSNGGMVGYNSGGNVLPGVELKRLLLEWERKGRR